MTIMAAAATTPEKTALAGLTRDGSGRPSRRSPTNMQTMAATSATTVPIAAPTYDMRGMSAK